MNPRKLLALGFIAMLLVTVASLVSTKPAQGQCLTATCPPAGGSGGSSGGGGGGERQKRPTATPQPTQTLAPTATLLPGAVLPALQPPALNGNVPGGPLNSGNPVPLGPVGPGPLSFSPWLGALILVVLVGLLVWGFRFFRRPSLGSISGNRVGVPDGRDNLTLTIRDTADNFDKLEDGGMQNFTVTRQDLGGSAQNFTVNRQDLGSGIQNGTIDVSDIGEINGGAG